MRNGWTALFKSHAILPAQIVIGCAGLLLLVAVPPAHGRMLLIPYSTSAATGLVAVALSNGARLIEEGPFPGSLVVSGDRAALFPAMLRQGVLVTASPSAGCGNRPAAVRKG
jgi:hypothetical protein